MTIKEIPLGKTSPEKPPTRLKIEEIDSNQEENHKDDVVKTKASPESVKLITEVLDTEKESRVANLTAPVNNVQFMNEWKYLKGNDAARSDYLSVSTFQKSKLKHF